MEYIWHCPRRSCGAIVLKTNEPFLKKNKKFKCKRCKEVISSEQLISANKRNIKRYLDDNDKKLISP